MRKLSVALLLVFQIGADLSAQELPSKEQIQKFVELSEGKRPADIRAMEAHVRKQTLELAAMRKAPNKLRKPADELDRFAAAVAADKDKIAKLKSGDLFFPAKMPKGKLEIGKLGVLQINDVHIVTIVSKSELIGSLSVYEGDKPWRPSIQSGSGPINPAEATAAAIATKRAELQGNTVPVISENVPVWFTNVPTAGMTDRTTVKMHQVFYVSGTKQYQTTAGTLRTVFVLTGIDDYGQKKG